MTEQGENKEVEYGHCVVLIAIVHRLDIIIAFIEFDNAGATAEQRAAVISR